MSISIDSMTALYNTEYTKNSTNALKDTLNSDFTKATQDELMDACKEFEAYFVEQMFKSMQKMVPESTMSQSSSTKQLQDFYKDEMVKTMAESATEGTGLGIAQTLYEQMKRNYNL